jgi:hypothetical protein
VQWDIGAPFLLFFARGKNGFVVRLFVSPARGRDTIATKPPLFGPAGAALRFVRAQNRSATAS